MKVTTKTEQVYSGYFMSVVVIPEEPAASYILTNEYGYADSVRLRDTAEALLAAADLLDSLK